MDEQPTHLLPTPLGEPPAPKPVEPPKSSESSEPSAKQPPDPKTVEALLAVTRTEHEKRLQRKAADMSDVPKGLIAGYIGRTVHAFSPDVLASSPRARRTAIIVGIGLVITIVLTFAF